MPTLRRAALIAAILLTPLAALRAQEGIPRPQDVPVPFADPDAAPLPTLPLPGERKPALPPQDEAAKPDADTGADKEGKQAAAPQDRESLLTELYAHLAKAGDQDQAGPIAESIETLWLNSGSATINLLMTRSLNAINDKKNELAFKLLDSIVDLAPDYAEGFNRRAYLFYLQNDYEQAIGDLRRALALEPNHFRALEGLARILRESGQKKAALKAYREILRIHPYLPGAKEAAEELSVEVEGQGI
jgi:tetratricopeptide (TPR) repeat protein